MMMKTEAQVLAEVFESTRGLTRWYLKKLQEVDVHKEFSVDGKVFNPVIWEVGHLANSTNFLGLYMTNGETFKYEWAPLFAVGASLPLREQYPEYTVLWSAFKETYVKLFDHISNLTDDQLNAPARKVGFAGISTVREAILHLIRHEGTHIGHLGWLCKMHGIKTV